MKRENDVLIGFYIDKALRNDLKRLAKAKSDRASVADYVRTLVLKHINSKKQRGEK